MKKKLLAVLLCAVLAVGLAAVPAGASNYDDAANELKEMNLFRGSDIGFELDRVPTRFEAAAMLVRLFGAEDGAVMDFQLGNISHPFKDVPDWADHYVAWMYSNGLTKGISETEYGTGNCTAQMYCTFILRALGYSEEAEDFTYDKAVEKTAQLGIFNREFIDADNFLRDHVAALSYQALASKVKGSDLMLIEKLVNNGAVEAETAHDFIVKADIYNRYVAAAAAFATASDLEMTVKNEMVYSCDTIENASGSTVTTSAVEIKTDEKGGILGHFFSDSDGITVEEWIVDDTLYISSDEGKYFMTLGELGIEDIMGEPSVDSGDPLYAIEKIIKNPNGSYTFSYNSAISSISAGMMEQLMGPDISFSFPKIDTTVTLDSAGMLKTNKSELEMLMTITVNGETHDIKYVYTVTSNITAYGDGVEVVLPDFNQFTEYPMPTA